MARSDPLDAVSAARAAQSRPARCARRRAPLDGAVEAIRALMVAKRSARSERIQTLNQARALILTGPEGLRARFARHTVAALVAQTAALRPRPGDVVGGTDPPGWPCGSWDAGRSSPAARSSAASMRSSFPW